MWIKKMLHSAHDTFYSLMEQRFRWLPPRGLQSVDIWLSIVHSCFSDDAQYTIPHKVRNRWHPKDWHNERCIMMISLIFSTLYLFCWCDEQAG
jgi:hypothetical protein